MKANKLTIFTTPTVDKSARGYTPATIDSIRSLGPMWSLTLHGDFRAADGTRCADVEFPSLYRALSFREVVKDMWAVSFRGDEIADLDAPVVMTVRLDA